MIPMYRFAFSILALFFFSNSYSQKVVNEATVRYAMSVETGTGEPKLADMLDGATTTVYVKGKQSRVELVSGLGTEATVYNEGTGAGFILKDYSGQKLMITLSPREWKSNNQKYEGIEFDNTNETKVISGYSCKKATARLKNNTSFTVWYTTEIKLQNKSYDPQFTNLPGLAVEYEMQAGKMNLKFTLAEINFGPVSSSLFEAPKAGYRVMTYDETKNKSGL